VITIETGANGAVPEVAMVYASKQNGAETRSVIKIKGGKIGEVGTYLFDEDYNEIADSFVDGVISISGGTFTEKPESKHIAPGYEILGENSPYGVQLKKVDLKDPTGEILNSLIINNGADAAVATRDKVLADIKNNENFNKDVKNDTAYTLIVVPQKVTVEAGTPYKTAKIVYSVTPVDANGNTTSNPGAKIKFNLPIPGFKPDYVTKANVYHEDELMGEYSIEGSENNWYVVVESAAFSKFTVELIDINAKTDSAKIGVKGYKTVQDAVNAAKDGDVIELLSITNATGVAYGNVTITPSSAKQITIDGHNNIWAYNGTDATITVNGGVDGAKLVTIQNVKFSTTKTSGEMIKVNGNGKSTNVLIKDCTFTGAGSNTGMVAINTSNANHVEVNGGTATGLKAFLVNAGGTDLTVKNVTIGNSNLGMELGTIAGVKVENVTITSTVGKYGISMDASVNNNAEFTSCKITAAVPVMVFNATANGKITFAGTNTLGTASSRYWIILADGKYSEMAEGTNPENLSTTGRIVVTVNDDGLNGDGINDKYQDSNKYYTVAPAGKLESAVVMDTTASHISLDIKDLKASERVVVEIYDEAGTKIAETKLVNKDVLYSTTLTGIVEIAYQSGSWDTTWLTDEKCPTYKNVPATAKLLVDGKVLSENVPVYMEQPVVPVSQMRPWTDVEGVGNLTVTTEGKTLWKHSLAEAFEAVAAGKTGTVTLFEGNKAVLAAAGEVTGGKTITVTGKATFDWGKDWLFIGRGENASGDGTLIFDNAQIKACDSKFSDGAVGFHVSGAQAGATNKNNGTLKIVGGSNVETDWLVNRNHVLVEGNSTLTVKYGMHHHGRPAGETPDSKDATAVIDVMDGATLKIQKEAVAAALGEEGHGQLNVDDATFICEAANLAIADKADTELNVSGTSTLNIKKVTGKAVNLLDEATLKDSTIGGDAVMQGSEEKPARVTFDGDNELGNLTMVDGKVYIDTESSLTANSINVETTDRNEIIIDATNLGIEPVKVIDLTGGSAENMAKMVSVKDNAAAKKIGDDGDVTVYFEAYIDKNGNTNLDAGEGYATIEQAVAAAADNQTVVLLADVSIEAALKIEKKIVLDLNEKTISTVPAQRGYTALKVTASGVTVKNGHVSAIEDGDIGIEVVEKATAELIDVVVNGKVVSIKASGNVIVNGGTIGNRNSCAIEMNGTASVTITNGNVIGAPAVRVYGGTLTVNGGKVTRKHDNANAIVTCSDGETENVATAVIINNGEIKGAIVAEDPAADAVMPKGYTVSVAIKGGSFTNSYLDWDYVNKEYASIAVSRANAEVPTIFDEFVPYEMIAPDFMCQEVKDSNPVKYEIVPYEHVRIYMDDVAVDQDEAGPVDRIVVGESVYVDGDAYKVQPGKVLLVSKEKATKPAMFITTYGYETKGTNEVQDDYPNAMYVWYAEGRKKPAASTPLMMLPA